MWALIEKRREKAKSARIGDIVERQEILTEIYRDKTAVEVPLDTVGAEIGETEDGKFLAVKVAVLDKTKIKAIDTQNKMDGLYVQTVKLTITHEDWLDRFDDDEKEKKGGTN